MTMMSRKSVWIFLGVRRAPVSDESAVAGGCQSKKVDPVEARTPVVPASRTTAGPHETTSSPPTGSFSRVQVPGTEQILVFSRSDLAPRSGESEDACRGYLTAIKRNTERWHIQPGIPFSFAQHIASHICCSYFYRTCFSASLCQDALSWPYCNAPLSSPLLSQIGRAHV